MQDKLFGGEGGAATETRSAEQVVKEHIEVAGPTTPSRAGVAQDPTCGPTKVYRHCDSSGLDMGGDGGA